MSSKVVLFLGLVASALVTPAEAGGRRRGGGDVSVRGYTRSNGTYVQPQMRSAPDGVFGNNWTTRGNVNPYTGVPGTRVSPGYSYGASGGPSPSVTSAPSRPGTLPAATAPGGDEAARRIEPLSQAIRANPGSAVAVSERGFEYHRRGDHDLAIADYTKAIELDPGMWVYRFNRGINHLGKDAADRAIADLAEAIRLNPSDHRPYQAMSQAYQKKAEQLRPQPEPSP
jgi:tetratricopeptide (TPR) repeat protein